MQRDLNRHTPILVPYADWDKSADALKWLSNADYLKQINLISGTLRRIVDLRWVEDNDNLKALPTWIESRGAAKMLMSMWLGYDWHLALYGMRLASKPGFKNLEREISLATFQRYYVHAKRTELPYWFGNTTLHESHQCWLIRHDSHYSHTFGNKMARSSDVLPLCWPPHHAHQIKYK